MTEGQYFNEFLVNEYITILSIENLFEKVIKDYKDEDKYTIWVEFKQKEIKKFSSKNREYLNEFTENYNIE